MTVSDQQLADYAALAIDGSIVADLAADLLEARGEAVRRDETIRELRIDLAAQQAEGRAAGERIAVLESALRGVRPHLPSLDALPVRTKTAIGEATKAVDAAIVDAAR